MIDPHQIDAALDALRARRRRLAQAVAAYDRLQRSAPGRMRAVWHLVRTLFGRRPVVLAFEGAHPLGWPYVGEDVLARYVDPAFYLAHNPDIEASGVDPVRHYVLHGAGENRRAHPLFVIDYYLEQNPDAVDAPGGAIRHYLTRGARQRRPPHPAFDAAEYAAAAGVPADEDALYAYLRDWRSRPAEPHAAFDTGYYLAARGPIDEAPLLDYVRAPNRPDPHPLIDGETYRTAHPDVVAIGMAPLVHYLRYGSAEGRHPNPWFDPAFYRAQNADVAASGQEPLVHWIRHGWRESRDPHPGFETAWYVATYLGGEAAEDPLVFWLREGRPRGHEPDRYGDLDAFRPEHSPDPAPADAPPIDVVIPIYGAFDETRACVESVLASALPTNTRIVAIDDASPDPALRTWLETLNDPRLTVLFNSLNLGFVRTANRGFVHAGRRDVILLNSDTVVAGNWVERLARAAYADQANGTVTPLSNNATLASYPRAMMENDIEVGRAAFLDRLTASVNAGRTFAIPTAVGFCMYVRRDALDAVGPFDEVAFGRGYGEENDLSQRLIASGWRNVLAADVFVYHSGGASFSEESATRKLQAAETIAARYPRYFSDVAEHARLDPARGARFALATAALRASGLPATLFVTHGLGGGIERHVREVARSLAGRRNVVRLAADRDGDIVTLEALGGADAFTVRVDGRQRYSALLELVRLTGVERAHVHHVLGFPFPVEALLADLGLRFDTTVHDFYGVCPQITMTGPDGAYCGAPDERGCDACIAARPVVPPLDIASWRDRFRWMYEAAELTIAPSVDTARRIERYHPHVDVAVAAHPV